MNEQNNLKLTATIVQVAKMYYDLNLSQQQIADNLGVSRSLIALYLKKAKDLQIVRIEIRDPQDDCEDIAFMIKSRSSVNKVVVVPSSHNSAELTRRSIAGTLARHLEHSLQDGDCLGVGFGRTIAVFAELLAPSKSRKIDVLPLIGESATSLIGTYSQVNLHVLKIARSFGGIPHFLLAPLFVHSDILRDMLISDETIRPVIEYWNHLTHICLGIGTLPPVPGEVIYIGAENLHIFEEAGGVGDICTRYYDSSGNFIDAPLYNRIIGININQIRKTKHIIALASGSEKAKSTAGLLKANLITELFIDEELARAVLNELG